MFIKSISESAIWLLCCFAFHLVSTENIEKRTALLVFDSLKSVESLEAWIGRPESEIRLAKSIPANDPSIRKVDLLNVSDIGIRYENLVIHASNIPDFIDSDEIVQFTLRGGNFLWIIPAKLGTEDDDDTNNTTRINDKSRNIALQFGRILFETLPVIHDYISSPNPTLISPIRVPGVLEKIMADPSGLKMEKSMSHSIVSINPLVFPILVASESSIGECKAPFQKNDAFICERILGTDNVIASALQTRDRNARITIITASIEKYLMNSNSEQKDSSESKAIADIASWTFKEIGVMELSLFTHTPSQSVYGNKKVDKKDWYRIGDSIVIDAAFSTKTGASQPMKPISNYHQEMDTVQVEISMMDTWVRADMHQKDDSSGREKTAIMTTGPINLPNRQGVYKIRINYQRHGWSHIIHEDQIVIRPLYMREHARFRLEAFPFYAAWVGHLLVTSVFLFPHLLSSTSTTK